MFKENRKSQSSIGMRIYTSTYNLPSLKSDKIEIALVREVKAKPKPKPKTKTEQKPFSLPASGATKNKQII